MKNITSTEIVLVLFAITACAGFILGKLAPELFSAALMTIFAFYFGGKKAQSEATEAIANAIAQSKDQG
jgi:hypothetical protein